MWGSDVERTNAELLLSFERGGILSAGDGDDGKQLQVPE